MNYKKIRMYAFAAERNNASAFAKSIGETTMLFFKPHSIGMHIAVEEVDGQYRGVVELYFKESQFENIPIIKDVLLNGVNTLVALEAPALGAHAVYSMAVDESEFDALLKEAQEKQIERLPVEVRDFVAALQDSGADVQVLTL